jgi:hypothetical protein
MKFRFFAESGTDIFGFEKERATEIKQDDDGKPIKSFDTELMMRYLSKTRIGVNEAYSGFFNEIQWGERYGAIKLEVSPRMLFLVQRLARDLEGNPRWIAKKAFQLNRSGYGGTEESVASEIYEHIKMVSENGLEGPNKDYRELSSLAQYMANKLQRCAQDKFIWRGIKKVSADNYQVVFEVGMQGVEAPHQRRVEQNVTDLSFDRECGTINIRNYNVESKVGGPHAWKVMPAYLNLYFFPSQDRSEIVDPFMVLMKYY